MRSLLMSLVLALTSVASVYSMAAVGDSEATGVAHEPMAADCCLATPDSAGHQAHSCGAGCVVLAPASSIAGGGAHLHPVRLGSVQYFSPILEPPHRPPIARS